MLETNKMFRDIAVGNRKLHALTDSDIKNIQNVLIEMMDDLDSLCRTHNLNYFLCGGTLLGAHREHGFIPWDEDLDVALPRRDYDRLFDLLQTEYTDKYHLQDIRISKKYDLTFMKLRKKNTKYIELFDTEPEVSGIFIDIYPLENTPDNAFLRFMHGAVSDFLYLCCSCVRIKTKKRRILGYLTDKKAIRLVKFKAFLGTLLSFKNMHSWCKTADKWSKKCKNDNSKFVTFPNGRNHYFGEMIKRETVVPTVKVPFEDRQYYVPHAPHDYLYGLYGDYMTVPPEDKRERHTVVQLDLGEVND